MKINNSSHNQLLMPQTGKKDEAEHFYVDELQKPVEKVNGNDYIRIYVIEVQMWEVNLFQK